MAVELAFKEARRVFIASLAVTLAFLLVKNFQKKFGGREDHLFKSLIGQKTAFLLMSWDLLGPFAMGPFRSFWVL